MAVHLSEQKQADYKDYLQRFQEDPQSISAEEAAQHYQELVSHAPPALANEANQQIMGLLPQNERDVLATNVQGGAQTPQTLGLLDHVLGKNSVLNTPLGKMVLSAAVAYLMKRMLSQQQGQAGAAAPSGGLGDIISSILSSAAGGQTSAGMPAPAGGGMPSGLGDILGALMGGLSFAWVPLTWLAASAGIVPFARRFGSPWYALPAPVGALFVQVAAIWGILARLFGRGIHWRGRASTAPLPGNRRSGPET